MKVSLSEVQGYAFLAVRGLGLPAGHGKALTLALAQAPAGFNWNCLLEAFAEPLEADRFRVIRDAPSLVDMLLCEGVQDIARPDTLPLLTLYMRVVEQDYESEVRIEECEERRCRLSLEEGAPASPIPPTRHAVPDPVLARLMELAARMYVPETEASRLKGAGAGLTDND